MSAQTSTWIDLNQRHLVAALAEVRGLLEHHADPSIAPPAQVPRRLRSRARARDSHPNFRPVALRAFDPAAVCRHGARFVVRGPLRQSAGDSARAYPTFSLALAALPDAHWSALTPVAPLRRWRLIEVSGSAAAPLTSSALRIDERILHYLTGIHYLDDRLAAILEPVRPGERLVPSHQEIAERIAGEISSAPQEQRLPILNFSGATTDTPRHRCRGVLPVRRATAGGRRGDHSGRYR